MTTFFMLVSLAIIPFVVGFRATSKVIGAFSGKIIFTRGELPEAADDKSTIAMIKKESLTRISGEMRDGVKVWQFRTHCFLKGKLRRGNAKLLFSGIGKMPASVTKEIHGADPQAELLENEVQLSADDGLRTGTYAVSLLVDGKTGPMALASGSIVLK